MNVYEHFGLKLAPFETAPDPRFFYPAPGHAETLATLEFALHAGKACCVVTGESGSGKTLLARVLCMGAGARAHVLWLHGLAHSGESTEVSLYSPGGINKAILGDSGQRVSLMEWIRARRFGSPAPLLVVDNAEELSPVAWGTIIAVLADEVRHPSLPNVILLGLPNLLNALHDAYLSRLGGRVFRMCALRGLGGAQVGQYVRHRLHVAGASDVDVFTSGALAEIERISRGIPARVNQICDNALIDGYSDERTAVNADDIVNVSRLTVGEAPLSREQSLPEPIPLHEQFPALKRLSTTTATRVKLPDLPPPLRRPVMIAPPAPAEPRPLSTRRWVAVPGGAAASVKLRVSGTSRRPAQGAAPKNNNLDGRLQSLETRLANALAVVRKARVIKNLAPRGHAPAGKQTGASKPQPARAKPKPTPIQTVHN